MSSSKDRLGKGRPRKKSTGGGKGPGGDPTKHRGSRGKKQSADGVPTPALEKDKEYNFGAVKKDEEGQLYVQTKRGKARVYLNKPKGATIDRDALVGRRLRLQVVEARPNPDATGPDKFVYRANIVNPERVAREIASGAGSSSADSTPDSGKEAPPATIHKVGDAIPDSQYSRLGEDSAGTVIGIGGLGPEDKAILRGADHLMEAGKYPELVCVSNEVNRGKKGRDYIFEVKKVRDAREFRKGGEFRDAKLKRNSRRPGEYTATVEDRNGDRKKVHVSAISLPITNEQLRNSEFAFRIVNDSEPFEGMLIADKWRDTAGPRDEVVDALAYYEDRNLEAAFAAIRGIDANPYGTLGDLTFSMAVDHLATALTTAALADPDYDTVGSQRTQIVHTYFDANLSSLDAGSSFETRIVNEQKGALYAESRVESQMQFMRGAAAAVARLNLLVPAVERLTPAIEEGKSRARGEAAQQLLLAEMSLIQGISDVGAEIVGIGNMMDNGNQTLNPGIVNKKLSELNNSISKLETVVHISEGLVDLAPESSLPRDLNQVIANPAMLKRIIRSLAVHDRTTFDKAGADRIDAVVDRLMQNVAHAYRGHEREVLHEALGGESYTALVEALRAVVGDQVDNGLGFMTVLPAGISTGGGDSVLSRNMDAAAGTSATRFEIRRGDYIIDVSAGTAAAGAGATEVVYFDTYQNRAEKRKRAAEYRSMLALPADQQDAAALAKLRVQVEADSTYPTSHMVCSMEDFVQLVKSGQIQYERDPQENNELTFRNALANASLADLIGYVQQNPRYTGALAAIDRAHFSYDALMARGESSLAAQALTVALSERGIAHVRDIIGDAWVDYPGFGLGIADSDTRDPRSSDFFFTVDGERIAGSVVTLTGDAGADKAEIQRVLDAVLAEQDAKKAGIEAAAEEIDMDEVDTDELETGNIAAVKQARERIALVEKINWNSNVLGFRQERLLVEGVSENDTPLTQSELRDELVIQMQDLESLRTDIRTYLADPNIDPEHVDTYRKALDEVNADYDAALERHSDLEVLIANEALDARRGTWERARDEIGVLLPLLDRFTSGDRPFVGLRPRFEALQAAHANLVQHVDEIDRMWTAADATVLLGHGNADVEALHRLRNAPESAEPLTLRPMLLLLGRHMTAWRDEVMQPLWARGRPAPSELTPAQIAAVEEYRDAVTGIGDNAIPGFEDGGAVNRINSILESREREAQREVRMAGRPLLYENVRGVCHTDMPELEAILEHSFDGSGDQPFLVQVDEHGELVLAIGNNEPGRLTAERAGALIQAGVLEIEYTPPVIVNRRAMAQAMDVLNYAAFEGDTRHHIGMGEPILCQTAVGGLRAGQGYIVIGADTSTHLYALSPVGNFDARTGQVVDPGVIVRVGLVELSDALALPGVGETRSLAPEVPSTARLTHALDRGEPLLAADIRRAVTVPELTIGGESRLRFSLAEVIPQDGAADVPAGTWLDIAADGFDDVHQRITAIVQNPDGSRGREVTIPYELYVRAEAAGSCLSWDTHRDRRVQETVATYEGTVAIPEPLTREGVARILLIDGFMVAHDGSVPQARGVEISLPSFGRRRDREFRRLSSMRVLQDRVQVNFSATPNPDGSPSGVQRLEMSFEAFQAALDNADQANQPSIRLNQDMSYWNDRRINHVLAEANFTEEYLASGLLYQGRPAEFTTVLVGSHLVVEARVAGRGNPVRMTFDQFEQALSDPNNQTVLENAQAYRPVDFYSAEWLQDLRGDEYRLMMDLFLDNRQVGMGDLSLMYREDPDNPGFVRTELAGSRTVRITELSATGTAVSSDEVPLREFLSGILNREFLTTAEASRLGVAEPGSGRPGETIVHENGLHPDMSARLQRSLVERTTPEQRPTAAMTEASYRAINQSISNAYDRIEAYGEANAAERRQFFIGRFVDDRSEEFRRLYENVGIASNRINSALNTINYLHARIDGLREDVEFRRRNGREFSPWMVPTLEEATTLERSLTLPPMLTPAAVEQVINTYLPEGDPANANGPQALAALEALANQMERVVGQLNVVTAEWEFVNNSFGRSPEVRLNTSMVQEALYTSIEDRLHNTAITRAIVNGNAGFRIELNGPVYQIQDIQVNGQTPGAVSVVVNNMNYTGGRAERLPLTRILQAVQQDQLFPV